MAYYRPRNHPRLQSHVLVGLPSSHWQSQSAPPLAPCSSPPRTEGSAEPSIAVQMPPPVRSAAPGSASSFSSCSLSLFHAFYGCPYLALLHPCSIAAGAAAVVVALRTRRFRRGQSLPSSQRLPWRNSMHHRAAPAPHTLRISFYLCSGPTCVHMRCTRPVFAATVAGLLIAEQWQQQLWLQW